MQEPLNYVTVTPGEAWSAELILEDVWDAREAVISHSFSCKSFRNCLHRTTSRLVLSRIDLLVLDNIGSITFLLVVSRHIRLSELKLLFTILWFVKLFSLSVVLFDCTALV